MWREISDLLRIYLLPSIRYQIYPLRSSFFSLLLNLFPSLHDLELITPTRANIRGAKGPPVEPLAAIKGVLRQHYKKRSNEIQNLGSLEKSISATENRHSVITDVFF